MNSNTAAMPPSAIAPGATRAVITYGSRTRLLISAFVLFHIGAVLIWLLPPSALHTTVSPVTSKYVSYVGVWQSWGMFAPDPSRLNIYISARVTYQDGSERDWSMPRMDQLDLFTRYYKERYRKYEEYLHLDAFSGVWPDMAKYVARLNTYDPGNPPVHVRLMRNWWIIPPPPAGGDISRDPPHEWQQYQFFETAIGPADR